MKIQRTQGFSLIEMIIYIAIVSMMMMLVVGTMFGVVNAYAELRLVRNVENSAIISLDRLMREIRQASSVDTVQSTFGTNPGTLVLNTTDTSGATTTVEFYITNGVMNVKKGGVFIGPLTSSSTAITNLVYTYLSTTTSSAIKIDMTLSSTRKATTKTGSFHTTTVLRGMY
jgi:prepilin-type N-terminal cleavage/methylation domain-containing protein